MKVRIIAALGLTALVLTLLGSAPAHAADSTIEVAPQVGQQVALDPDRVAVQVLWKGNDCRGGCELWRWGHLRFNEQEELIDTATFLPASPLKSVTDVLEYPPLPYAWDYQIRKIVPGGTTTITSRPVDQAFDAEGALTYAGPWRRDLNLQSTETMIMRSVKRGDAARVEGQPVDRHVGIISAKGPNNGRMKISAGARTVSVDLHAVRWTPRQLVAEVMVPAGVALVITNDSPATGTRRDVHVDGLATLSLGHYRSADPAADSPPPARASAAAESITAAIPVGSTLAPVPTTFSIDLTAKVHGCPQGCAIVAVDDGFDEQTLLTHTSPATPGLETLRIRVPAPPWVWYELRKNGTEVVSTGILGGELVQDAFLLYSHGWVRDANGTTIGDSIMRSSTRRTGATYRVSGTWEGRDVGVIAAKGPRNGVMAIYVNGVLRQTVDLKSATWQPRLIVAAVELPLRGRITLVNATPAGRVAADVHVDGLAILDHPEDWYRTAS